LDTNDSSFDNSRYLKTSIVVLKAIAVKCALSLFVILDVTSAKLAAIEFIILLI
jgi:hypothetical protein